MEYSVIVLMDEANEDFSHHILTLIDVFLSTGKTFEITIVANGTGGFLKDELPKLSRYATKIKAFELSKKNPQAVCLRVGFEESSGKIIAICGSYQQLSEESLRLLLDSMDENTDIISPWRQQRVDPSINQLQSHLFNSIVRNVTGVKLHDLSCTVKVCRREVLKETELYGNMPRFLPILAERKGFKTKEVKCEHYQEHGTTGIYRISEYIERLIDIFTLYFVTQFSNKPLRFFSFLGSSIFIFGFLLIGDIFFEKVFWGRGIGDHPLLLIGVFLIALGVQVASMGLLGEIIVFTHGRKKAQYTIEKVI